MKTAALSAIVIALLSSHLIAADEVKPIRALLITGGCCHDYINQKKILTEGVSARANVHWTIVHQGGSTTNNKIGLHENENWADGYDVIVHNECFAEVTDKDFVQRVLKPHKAGKPAVVIHCAMHNYRDKTDEWFKFTGITSHSHGAHYAIDVEKIKHEKPHPIMEGFPDKWTTKKGELYFSHKVWDTATPLGHAMSRESKKHEVCIWVNDYNKGTRVFGTTIGHYNEEMSDPVFLTYVTRGLLWSVDKLNAEYLKPASKDLKTIEIDPFGADGKSPRPADAPLAPGQKKPSVEIKPGTKVPVNLALGKKASAPRSQEGHTPGNAIDGNADTRWCAPDWNTMFTWQLDLGKAEDITGINIAWEKDDAPYGYKIDASDDAKTWRTIIDTTEKPIAGELHQHVAHTRTQHLRVTITKLKAGCWASFWEFEVLGKEMVEAGKPGASSLLSLDRPTAASAEGLLAQVKIAPGYKATLFAAPPQVSYPTCIAAAPTGEVFIGIDENGSLGKDGKRAMKVIRAVDSDNDGKADTFTTFCTINNPRGLFFHDNTLIVLGPPNLRAFTDTNGDGIADSDKLLVSGLGSPALAQRGADHCTNGFTVGIDGWLYIAVGDFGAIKATGSDGKSVQLHGGGIIRVRPDGGEIEIVTRGQRNIYDVAIDPLLNMFTRDNTNDGDGWNVRLSHVIHGGNYGYPSLFKNFPDDIIQPLADYGGGSPTGALYIDEPGVGAGASGLLTCDWGRSIIYRHPLTADGAGFKAQQQSFIELPRPTDMDVDGSGRIYIASWREGGFSYAKPDVGYVVRVTANDAKAPAFPDLRKASDRELLAHLATPSHVTRLHAQWEMLRRGDNETLAAGITNIAGSRAPLPVRVAAIFTLKQLRGAKANDALVALAKDEVVREFALRALADRITQTEGVAVQPFVDATRDANPRVRLQASTALGRLGRVEYANAIVPLVADPDARVSHLAVGALVSLRASEACMKVLEKADEKQTAGLLRVLRSIHDPQIPISLAHHMGGSEDFKRRLIITALCRLYHDEGAWTGDWWGTRPDTRGPYYNPVTWEASTLIASILTALLSDPDCPPELAKFTVGEITRHRIDLAAATGPLIKSATADPSLRPMVVSLLIQSAKLPAEATPLLESVAKDAKENADLRARAATALAKSIDQPAAFDAAIDAFAALASTGGTSEPVLLARENFAKDKRHQKNVNAFVKLAGDKNAGKRETAFSVLLVLATDKQLPKSAVTAGKAIDAGWSSADAGSLLRAVALVNAKEYAVNVKSFLGDTRPAVREAAQATAKKLNILGEETADPNKITLAKLGFDKSLALMKTEVGDIKRGQELFTTQGCVKCHTVAQDEPLKGPLLLGISQRYSRAEIIEAILKPGAKVSQGFETQWFQMEDGLNYEGFVVRESAVEIEMRNVAGAVTVLKKKEIEERGKRETSMMPTGLVDTLDAREFASILAYLESLKAK